MYLPLLLLMQHNILNKPSSNISVCHLVKWPVMRQTMQLKCSIICYSQYNHMLTTIADSKFFPLGNPSYHFHYFLMIIEVNCERSQNYLWTIVICYMEMLYLSSYMLTDVDFQHLSSGYHKNEWMKTFIVDTGFISNCFYTEIAVYHNSYVISVYDQCSTRLSMQLSKWLLTIQGILF